MAQRNRKVERARAKADAARAPSLWRVLPALGVALLAIVVMAPLCAHEFTNWDDDKTVRGNPDFNPPSFAGVMRYWREPFMDLYVPVTYVVWGVVASVAYDPSRGGLDPRVFHAFNVLLHAANAAMAFLLLRRLVGGERTWAALAGAALFAVHPVQVETVAWVSGMKDLLCGLLTLIALWGYVAFARHGLDEAVNHAGRRRGMPPWGFYALGTVAYVLAMLAKPTAVVTPVMAALVDLLVLRRGFRRTALAVLPWAVLAVPCVIWTKQFQQATHVVEAPILWLRPLVALDALAFYAGKLVFPWSLAIDYGRTPQAALRNGWAYWTWVVPITLAIILWFMRRRFPGVVAGAALAVTGLLPVLGLVRFDFQEFSTVADHYLYLPMFGIGLLVAACLAKAPVKRWAGVSVLVLVVLAGRSMAQTRHWSDSVALFRHTLSVNPDSAGSYNGLAAALLEQGKAGEALAAAEAAVGLKPDDAQVRGTHAAILAAVGRLPEAEAAYRTAVALDPPVGKAQLLAQLAGQAIELDPREPVAHMNLGVMLADRGQLEEAARELATAGELARDPRAYLNAGAMMARIGRLDEARRYVEAALSVAPRSAEARGALAELDRAQGRR
jgi:protein O-mannosyl-transferase